jgi:hypothetical protein
MTVPPTPRIRDISVVSVDDFYCLFNVYFDPAPEDATLELYLDGTLSHASLSESGGLSVFNCLHLVGSTVRVKIVFQIGIVRSHSNTIYFKCASPEGLDTELDGVASSNLAAVGWRKYINPHYLAAPDAIRELDSAQVCELLSNYEMSEEEARERLHLLGYTQEDIDYLVILNSPD